MSPRGGNMAKRQAEFAWDEHMQNGLVIKDHQGPPGSAARMLVTTSSEVVKNCQKGVLKRSRSGLDARS